MILNKSFVNKKIEEITRTSKESLNSHVVA